MDHMLEELPPLLKVLAVRREDCLVLVLPRGAASVEIEELSWEKNVCSFAGKVDEEPVRGYFDFEAGRGGLMSV